MGEVKHTPGPWEALDGGHYVCPEGNHGQFVAIVSGHVSGALRPEAERKANARLLASAPDLLEAACGAEGLLRAMYPTVASDRDAAKVRKAFDALAAAIAKATGSDQ
jgi:hypothetical protein